MVLVATEGMPSQGMFVAVLSHYHTKEKSQELQMLPRQNILLGIRLNFIRGNVIKLLPTTKTCFHHHYGHHVGLCTHLPVDCLSSKPIFRYFTNWKFSHQAHIQYILCGEKTGNTEKNDKRYSWFFENLEVKVLLWVGVTGDRQGDDNAKGNSSGLFRQKKVHIESNSCH